MAKDSGLRYWQIVSQGMELEDQRLRIFVEHRASLGIGRENILRKFLAEQTAEPCRISTGFVVHPAYLAVSSDQCDVLVYDPRLGQPLYRIEEFVVVPAQAARLAIEVRSNMSVGEKSGVDQVFKVHKSMRNRFPAKVFGFGFRGPTFEKFIEGIAMRVHGDVGNVPECIVVHSRNYLCIRVDHPNVAESAEKRMCLAIDFEKGGPEAQGYATALFLWCYQQRIEHNVEFNAVIVAIHARDLGVPYDKLWVIRSDGSCSQGFDPDKR